MKIEQLQKLDPQVEWLIPDNSLHEVHYLTDSSQEVQSQSFFLCYSVKPQAITYIEEAIKKGATVIAVSKVLQAQILKKIKEEKDLPALTKGSLMEELLTGEPLIGEPLIGDSILWKSILWAFPENFQQFATRIAAYWFSQRPSCVVAVTGTNGKTSTVNFLYQLWSLKGLKAASIGTLGVQGDFPVPISLSKLTTPSPVELYKTLDILKQQGVEYTVLEASSHGLHQHRLQAVSFKAAAFTNLTQDHLDYHQTMEEYFNSKAILFRSLLINKENAVLNVDDPSTERLIPLCGEPLLYSLKNDPRASLALIEAYPHQEGQRLRVRLFNQVFEVFFPFLGNFLIANAFCAFGLLLKTVPHAKESDIQLLEHLKPVKGRLQQIPSPKGKIFIDYAHTPDGLENVLKSLKSLVEKRLMVVFGCGGDRDKTKRAKMGQVADLWADWIGITDDNPRTEDPVRIRQEIKAGCPKAVDLGDRETAIQRAVKEIQHGDILLIAGKGHESVQTIGEVDYPFDDQKIVENILRSSHTS